MKQIELKKMIAVERQGNKRDGLVIPAGGQTGDVSLNIAKPIMSVANNIPKEISQLEQEISNIQGQSVNGTYTPEQTALIDQLRTSVDVLKQSYYQYVNTYDTLNGIQVTLLQDAQVPQKPVGAGSARRTMSST